MKYDNRSKFRHVLVKLLEQAEIKQSPPREKFISLSWQVYTSPKDNLKLFANRFGKNRYDDYIKKIKKKKLLGNYLYIITDGNPTNLLY